MDDTIVALSTPQGLGAVAVIRMSGPDAGPILERVTRNKGVQPQQAPRRLIRGWVVDHRERHLDEVLVVFMPGPNSYTGEDMAEIHCHGGEAVAAVILDELLKAGARGALRGEFTRRALEHGKLDLSRAEAVIRMIMAASREQVLGASRALDGEVEDLAREVQADLLESLARVEAAIDFPDEPEVDGVVPKNIDELARKVESLHSSFRRVAPAEVEVVVAGKPNVGKSSLVNRLAKRQVSIVTSEPGTTRDAVRAGVYLHGARVDLVDTAGQGAEEPTSEAAREAERVAREKVSKAGLLVWVTDRPDDAGPATKALWVVNKSDLLKEEEREKRKSEVDSQGGLLVSAKTGQGMQELFEELSRRVREEYGPADGIPLTARQAEALRCIHSSASQASRALSDRQPELAAVDLRDALKGVSDLLGEDVEIDVIDRIFSEFCIGK